MAALQDHIRQAASPSETSSSTPMMTLAPGERRASIELLSPRKRAALIACLKGGILRKRLGVWITPSPNDCERHISGVTVADLARDGMLTLSVRSGIASAELNTRGSWFARTAMTEMARS